MMYMQAMIYAMYALRLMLQPIFAMAAAFVLMALVIRNTEKGPNLPVVGWFIRNLFRRADWIWIVIVDQTRFLKGKWGIPVEDKIQSEEGIYLKAEDRIYLKKNFWGGVSPVAVYRQNRPVAIYLEEFSHSRESSDEARTAIARAYAKTSFQVHLSTLHNPIFIMAFMAFMVSLAILMVMIFKFFIAK